MVRQMFLRGSVLALFTWPLNSLADCADASDRLRALHTVVQTRHATQDALVLVRRSAQDFKNVLLRAGDPAWFQMLRQRFDRNAQSYEQRLALLDPMLAAVPGERERADLLKRERSTLIEGYRQALQTHDVRRMDEALAADKAVQGLDVKTLRALEASIDNLNAHSDAAFEALHQALQSCGP